MLFALGCRVADDSGPSIRVFSASSLTDVLEAVADSFESSEAGDAMVRLHLAGSSLLARQMEFGAGADVFVSAHPRWTDYLYERGLIDAPVELPITTRLVLVSRDSSTSLRNVKRLALADPEHVPSGIYAKQALECERLWTELSGKVAAVVDVRAALAAVGGGAADAAIVYESDVQFTPTLKTSMPFSPNCQPDVTYTIAIVREAGEAAGAFVDYVLEPSRESTWSAFGFVYRSGATQ